MRKTLNCDEVRALFNLILCTCYFFSLYFVCQIFRWCQKHKNMAGKSLHVNKTDNFGIKETKFHPTSSIYKFLWGFFRKQNKKFIFILATDRIYHMKLQNYIACSLNNTTSCEQNDIWNIWITHIPMPHPSGYYRRISST